MDSDYHLLGSKDLDKEEKKEKKKEHSSAYFRFINQFKNHLKKIENNFSTEEVNPLTNHFNFINKCENEIEEQRENCLNCYKVLKEQISLIEKYIPNFDVNVFNTFFQTFEEYYSFFEKTKDILKKFSKYNDDTLNLFAIYKIKNNCIEVLKEFVDKISEEYADKIEQYDLLNQKFQELTESYEKLYKIYSEKKNSESDKYNNNENKDLIISKLNQKIQDLNIENDRINRKYLDCNRELEKINMHLKFNYVLKSESENKINEYKYKLSCFENENMKIKEEIKNLRKENEILIEQKEHFEGQMNNILNNINHEDGINNIDDNNNINNLENIMNNNDLIEENEEEEFEKEKEKDLGELLADCEEYESEEIKEEPNKNNNTEDKKETSITININNINNEKNEKPENYQNKLSKGINNKKKYKKSKTIRLISKDITSKELNMKKSNIFNGYKGKISSDDINSSYNVMFKGRQFQYATRISSKEQHDYFKQFFFLLLQSMKLNSDNISIFLGYNPETLYNQCRKEHIPFYKYQKWIEKKLLKKEITENYKRYEDFSTITGIFCSSLI